MEEEQPVLAVHDRCAARHGRTGRATPSWRAAPNPGPQGPARRLPQVRDQGALEVPVVEDGGGVVRHEEGRLTEPETPSPDLRQGRRGPEQASEARRSQGDDHPGMDRLNLGREVRTARGDLRRTRRTVRGRSALHHIRDEDSLPAESGSAEGAFEDPTRGADEGPTRLVFPAAWGLADQEDGRPGRAFSGHRVGPRLVQGTASADPDERGDLLENPSRLVGHAGPKVPGRLIPSWRDGPSARSGEP